VNVVIGNLPQQVFHRLTITSLILQSLYHQRV
jgi:hypothetical protein